MRPSETFDRDAFRAFGSRVDAVFPQSESWQTHHCFSDPCVPITILHPSLLPPGLIQLHLGTLFLPHLQDENFLLYGENFISNFPG